MYLPRFISYRSAGWLFSAWLIFLFLSQTCARADTNSAAVYLSCLTTFETYAESIWHTATGTNVPADSGYFGDGNSGGNGGIRGSTGVAVAYAVVVQALPSDPKNPTRLAHIRQALNYAANTHVSGSNVCIDGLQWGQDWQTAMWAGQMGFACQLMQSNLPAATVAACQRAVADEATYRAGIAPPSGYVGDTKAEENGWNCYALALAAAWMSNSNNANLWLTGTKQYMANTYTVANTNGDPLALWITTTNLYPDFELQNHGFYYPIYQMVAGMELGDSLMFARLANPSIASQLQPFAEHNVMNVWAPLSLVQADGGDFEYPAGLDWTLHDYEQNSYMAWIASHFNDPFGRWADTQLVKLVSYRQQLNGDGRYIGPSETDTPFYREAVEDYRTAIAYLQHIHADYTNGPITAPVPYAPQLFADVGLIEQRGTGGYFSISYWGTQIMAIIAPPAISIPSNCFLVTPRLPGVLGLGALGNPTGATLISFATNANGFDAELKLTNGTLGTTEVYVKSAGEAVGIVEVPWPAFTTTGSGAASFTVGIENQPLTGGTRLLEWTGGSATITNRSGVSKTISNGWICVAGQYGISAGPSGHFTYQAASSYNILGAAQDTLSFAPDQSLKPRYAVWYPGKNALTTQSNANLITWTNSGANAILTFPGPAGTTNQILVSSLPPALSPYAPYPLSLASITASSSQASYPPTLAADTNLSTFWVSSGVNPGQGPTTNHPEWLLGSFSRQVAISEFQVAPRTLNGGYGPKAVQMLLNSVSVCSGTMAATSTLDVHLSPPVYATNAELLITSSYDPSYPTNSRNVQVVELTFFERAMPGTFGDWMLQHFTDSQLTNAAVGLPGSDPDGDGVPNLLEFVVGGNPLAPDPTLAKVQTVAAPAGSFAFTFRERTNLSNVQREFVSSPDLANWTVATPSSVSVSGNLGTAYMYTAVFPRQSSNAYYRIEYTAPSN